MAWVRVALVDVSLTVLPRVTWRGKERRYLKEWWHSSPGENLKQRDFQAISVNNIVCFTFGTFAGVLVGTVSTLRSVLARSAGTLVDVHLTQTPRKTWICIEQNTGFNFFIRLLFNCVSFYIRYIMSTLCVNATTENRKKQICIWSSFAGDWGSSQTLPQYSIHRPPLPPQLLLCSEIFLSKHNTMASSSPATNPIPALHQFWRQALTQTLMPAKYANVSATWSTRPY